MDQTIKIVSVDADKIQFVIYDNPTDYPGQIVVRPWYIAPGVPMPISYHWTFQTVEAARRAILGFRPWAICFVRNSEDEPQIVETWW